MTSEKIGGLIAVDRLIDIAYDDATSIIANYYRFGFKTQDPQAMKWAAKTMGHLSTINSNITAECVEFDLQRALEWLQVKNFSVLLSISVLKGIPEGRCKTRIQTACCLFGIQRAGHECSHFILCSSGTFHPVDLDCPA